MGLTVQANAKLLLFGEHSAVWGFPAIGLGLPWTLTIKARNFSHWVFDFHKKLLKQSNKDPVIIENLRLLIIRFEDYCQTKKIPTPEPKNLKLKSEFPMASGFGSSSALCAALARLFLPDHPNLWEEAAYMGEQLFHGKPSGIDTALALRPGWWKLQPTAQGVVSAPLPKPDFIFITGALKRKKTTKELVHALALKKEQNPIYVQTALEELGKLASSVSQNLENLGADCNIPLKMNRAQEILSNLNLSTPELETVFHFAKNNTGALGAKFSGAGGGGAFILAYPDKNTAYKALKQLKSIPISQEEWVLRPCLIREST